MAGRSVAQDDERRPMVTIDCPRLWPVLSLLPALVLVHPSNAHADRIDIDDPSVLGPVLHSVDLGDRSCLQGLITEVRYAAGIYWYVYAIQTSPYFPLTACCEPTLLRFTVTGHSLEETWGAINSSNDMWDDEGNPVSGPTNTVVSMTPVHNGFLVVPEGNGAGSLHRGLHAVASPAIGARDSHLHWPSERP